MGCGASTHAQGPEQLTSKEASKDVKPDPLTEDAPPAQKVKGDLVQPGAAARPTSSGAPAPGSPAPPGSQAASAAQQHNQQQLSTRSAGPDASCSSWGDELSPCAAGPTSGAPQTACSDDAAAPQPPTALPTASSTAAASASVLAGSPTQSPQPGSSGRPPHPQLPLVPGAATASGGSRSSNIGATNGSSSNTGFDETRLILGAPLLSSCVTEPAGEAAAAATAETGGWASGDDPGRSSAALDPAVTPGCQTATVTLLPEALGRGLLPPGGRSRSRYTDPADLAIPSYRYNLDKSCCDDSDDEDEVAALFTLESWKRFYNYNKNKHHDLVTYFWRRFPPGDFSCFVVAYRNQELLLTDYMAENSMHGYCARLQDLGLAPDLFSQMYALQDPELDSYLVVGWLLVPGATLPGPLAALSAYDGFVYTRAETGYTVVRQFITALLMGQSPLHSLKLVAGRDVL